MNEQTELANPIAIADPTMLVTNKSATDRRVMLRDGHRQHVAIVDPTKPDPQNPGKFLPKLYGDPRFPKTLHCKFEDEIEVVFPAGRSVPIPRRFLNAGIFSVVCDICRGSPRNLMGRCFFLHENEHRRVARIVDGAMLGSPLDWSIDFLERAPAIPIDARVIEFLEEDAKSNRGNHWGADFHEPMQVKK